MKNDNKIDRSSESVIMSIQKHKPDKSTTVINNRQQATVIKQIPILEPIKSRKPSNPGKNEDNQFVSAKMKRLLLAIGILFTIFIAFYLYRFFWSPKPIVKTPVIQAVAGLVQPDDNGEAIRVVREHEKNNKPFPLLANKPDLAPVVSPTAINLLIMARDVEANLYDTLMVVSMNPDTGRITLLSVPRDLYVDYSDEALAFINKKISGMNSSPALRKINAAHKLGKLIHYREDTSRFGSPDYDFTADLVEEMFSLSIDDFMFIHPDSFKKVVDEFGGVVIDVPYTMKYRDRAQDLNIDLKPGPQLLDGVNSEGFVRFRKGTNSNGKWFEIGDVERKENQNMFVKAFFEQHLNLANIGKLIDLANRYTEFVDTSITGNEKIGDYALIGKNLISEHFVVDAVTLETKFQTIFGYSQLVLGSGVDAPSGGVINKPGDNQPQTTLPKTELEESTDSIGEATTESAITMPDDGSPDEPLATDPETDEQTVVNPDNGTEEENTDTDDTKQTTPTDETTPTDGTTPTDETAPTDKTSSTDKTSPTDKTVSTGKTSTTDASTSAEKTTLTDKTSSTDASTPAEKTILPEK